MRLFTPDSLLYPVTVTKLLRQPGDDIEQNAPLFTYEYKSVTKEWDSELKEKVEKVLDIAKELEKANKVVRKYNRSRSSGCDADKGTDDRARYDGLSHEHWSYER